MIKEVIGTILEAENKAAQIVKEANENALKMYAQAKQRAHEINKEAKEEIRLLAQESFLSAEKQGEKEAEIILNNGKKAEKALDSISTEKYDKAEEYILRRLYKA